MKKLKSISIFFSLLAVVSLSFFITSCQKTDEIKLESNLEYQIQKQRFSKKLSLLTKDNIDVKLNIASNDDLLLNLIDINNFDVDFVYEIPEIVENQTNNSFEEELSNVINPDLMISIDDIKLPKNAFGVKISFKQSSEIKSRYDRVSTYYYSVNLYKGIATSNRAEPSIKMKYYDDHQYAGYRSLCTGKCSQISYTFGRSDTGVGCQYEYWGSAYKNVGITFLP